MKVQKKLLVANLLLSLVLSFIAVGAMSFYNGKGENVTGEIILVVVYLIVFAMAFTMVHEKYSSPQKSCIVAAVLSCAYPVIVLFIAAVTYPSRAADGNEFMVFPQGWSIIVALVVGVIMAAIYVAAYIKRKK